MPRKSTRSRAKPMPRAKAPKATGNKGGRPRVVISPDQIRKIETLAGYGLTIPQIGAVIEVAESTLRLRKSDSDSVSSAFARGKAKAEAIVGEALFLKAKAQDVQAIRWWEMTRAGRSERQETAGTLGTFDLENMTDAQLARLAAGESPASVLRDK